ncbi:CD276 antigen-like isoform X2 [Acipenser oxyrinchus oxyrinchus]|uniref:CD276 antigen-like isoform X2 n=1 Tax=Acipenser oxyrinchus oxyrinchus TaxID=40147 RepID=A0AAD8CJX1_ACIOX|nr:CD276 antigen-like isoform X2 [Acipenser oxyrinchus oxyrinchus]
MEKLTSLMYILQLIQTYDAVTVPRSPVTSPPGSDVTLSCSFSCKAGVDLRKAVITWQRPPADDVVHDYYYGQDQLALQNETYRNRTQLFPEQLSVGNASLRLKQVRGEDEGWYNCAVTNQGESTWGDVRLIVAAELSEPQLVVTDHPDNPDKALLSCISTGYPSASVQWLNETGCDITESSRTSQSLDRDGLVEITSHILVSRDANYTCVLTHSLLKQTLKKTITLTKKGYPDRHHIVLWVVLTVVGVAAVIIAISLLFKRRCDASTQTDPTEHALSDLTGSRGPSDMKKYHISGSCSRTL